MLAMLFMMSVLGLAGIVGLSFFGKYGNLLRKQGVFGSIMRGMAGVFSFFIVIVILIWTIGALLVFGIIAIIATLFGWRFKTKGFSWSAKSGMDYTGTTWPSNDNETKIITLEPNEWNEPQAPKKPRRTRTKKSS